MTKREGSSLTFGLLVALVAGVTLGNAGSNVMPVFVEDMAARFRMSDFESGLVAASQLLATAVMTLTMSGRATRPGRVRSARLGLVVAVAGFLGAAFSSGSVTLVLSNLVIGVGLGLVYAMATAALASTDDPDKASTVTVVGTVCASALLLMAVPAANHSLSEGFGFLVMVAACLMGWPSVGRLPDASPTSRAGVVQGEKAKTASRPSAVLLTGVALLWAVTQGAWSYAAVLGHENTGMSPSNLSIVLAVSSVVALAGAVAGPYVAGRLGRMRSLAGFVVVQAVCMALLVLTHSPLLFTAMAVVWQAAQLAVLVQTLGAAAALDSTGRLVASLSGASAMGVGFGPLLVGTLLDTAGVTALGILLGVGTFVASLPILRMTVSASESVPTVRKHDVAPVR
ncbi:MFS transporter [Streptomyces sp. 11x1]|uniref:MFS transporter n=1 Tax=Streptomyces sp. 11x1 TaxID=3038642 RepID=UPI00292FF5E6|nr:MFS transporter [Streptomyces sp. 11x1]WNZ06741.1 MFS transporter [Streptomyces sp. 11x1]